MTKRDLLPVQNELVRLRLLQVYDLQTTLRWRNQDHIRRWFFYSAQLTFDQHAAWYEKYQTRDNDFVFIIEELASSRPVGQVALYDIDWEARRGEFGRLMIGEADVAGKGLALAATHLAVHVATQVLGLQEIILEVFADNARAIAIYEKAGFEAIERLPDVWRMRLLV